MPDTTTTETPTERAPLVDATIKREKGKLLLVLDCARLHAWLDAMGIERDAHYNRFADAPPSRASVIDTSEHALVPRALCTWQITDSGERTSTLTFNVGEHYTTPPTLEVIPRLRDSIERAVLAVIAHYQPVSVSVRVYGKGLT